MTRFRPLMSPLLRITMFAACGERERAPEPNADVRSGGTVVIVNTNRDLAELVRADHARVGVRIQTRPVD